MWIRRLRVRTEKDLSDYGLGDYNQGKLSAFDGDFVYHGSEMRQIIQEQHEKKEEMGKGKDRQKRLREISAVSLNVRMEGTFGINFWFYCTGFSSYDE